MKKTIMTTAILAVLSACGDPLADVEKLSDVELADLDTPRGVVAAPEDVERKVGLLSGLFRRAPAEDLTTRVEASDDLLDAQPMRERGLAGLILLGAGVHSQTVGQVEPDVDVATLEPDVPLQAQPRGRNRAPRGALKISDVAPGAELPFGEIARVCDAKGTELGKRIEKAGKGRGYTLYDSAPGSTVPRSFYVTGFQDGCPRKFTAALALFGDPKMHEQLRYGRPADTHPYSDTDKAYEKVKSAVCRVGRRKPCGSQINKLERDTVFISTYERFTDNGRWADILLHDGAVMAAAIKDL